MKIGLYSDALSNLNFEQALDWAVAEGIETVEIGTGNFSPAPHCNLDELLDSKTAREQFLGAIAERGLTLSALNCNGNLLDPDPGRRDGSQAVFTKTVKVAGLLGIDTVVTMSGCPGDLQGGGYPNWVTCTWQREYVELLERQWEEEISPFWKEAAELARANSVRIAIEMHPGQAVYNTRTLLRLRELCGAEVVGANLDPSHLFFQGMDPVVVVKALGQGGIFHVHAKDTRINAQEMALNGALDTRPMVEPGIRSWEYVTLGYGHGESFWRNFISTLRIVGYNGTLSIEHEDMLISSEEGIRKSIRFLEQNILRSAA
ncbi:MAG: sugar phosphate isomerase/epimerase [Chloroflexi bacterium]|nr:sugar phosphate isomerase/epimerase [Chloroflexota bacterium]